MLSTGAGVGLRVLLFSSLYFSLTAFRPLWNDSPVQLQHQLDLGFHPGHGTVSCEHIVSAHRIYILFSKELMRHACYLINARPVVYVQYFISRLHNYASR